MSAVTRIERRNARTARRRRALKSLVAPAVAFVLAASTLGAARTSTASEPFAAGIDATIADIQAYWAGTMPDVYGVRYQAIPADRLVPYSESDPPPGCGTIGRMPYAEVAGNAFYCPASDFVAWDVQTLFPRLTRQFGAFAPALVLAHEWGHAIQARVGFETRQTVYLEQQADCFAGAWAAHVASGDGDLHLSDADLDRALAGLLQLSDPVGIDASQDGAHGNGFDRVSAFQDGVANGADACASYETDPPSVTESGFTSQGDYASGGDMAIDELLPAITDALDTYWSDAVGKDFATPKLVADASASCVGTTSGGVLVDSVVYCPASNTISYDPATLRSAYSTIGDFGAGLLVAAEWSSAVQHELREPLGTPAARRGAECLAGAFAGDLDANRRSAGGDGITLSPGDLDEVISMLVAVDSNRDHGTAFSRVSAFRSGYFKGPNVCITA